MIDASIPYHDVIMVRPGSLPQVSAPALPEGYAYRMYAPGMEAGWSAIETAVKEFTSEAQASAHFAKAFLPQQAELPRRMAFVVKEATGRPVADATAWWMDNAALGRVALLHWVAVAPEAQGKGLGRAISMKALSRFPEVGPGGDIWLTTQTWSHVAIGLYLSLGFRAHRTYRLGGHENGFEQAVPVLERVMPAAAFARLVETAVD